MYNNSLQEQKTQPQDDYQLQAEQGSIKGTMLKINQLVKKLEDNLKKYDITR